MACKLRGESDNWILLNRSRSWEERSPAPNVLFEVEVKQHPMTPPPTPLLRPGLTENAADHAAGDVLCQAAGGEGGAGEVGGLAEFVAAREGEGIGDGEDQSNDCRRSATFLSSSIRARANSPISVSQMNSNLTSATMASATHSTGCTYRLSQKKRLSVPLMWRVSGSADSNTQRDSPVAVSTSFHQRSPTSRRPAMFLR